MRAPAQNLVSSPIAPSRLRGRLFRKYAALFVLVVSAALLANGLVQIWFFYQENKASLVRVQREQAQAAAAKIDQFVGEIVNQLGWTVQLPWSQDTLNQRRFDALRLLRQVPAITELSQLDATGHEQLHVSRLAMDVVGSNQDLSQDPKFKRAVAEKVFYGPVYFRRESEPYMTVAIAGARKDAGVSVAEVNLKFIWDVITQIKVGQRGRAYVVDAGGRLVAHPDISLVLRNTDLSNLAQVRKARAGNDATQDETETGQDVDGHQVLSAHAAIPSLGWIVFAELPAGEAYAPLYQSIERSGAILAACLVFAFLSGIYLARRMVLPIEALRAGAVRLGAGDLEQRIAVKTGDELEALADEFNDMAGRLQESYAGLERKVDDRTRELSEALERQTATADILRVIASTPGDPTHALDTIAETAVRMFDTASVGIRRIRANMLSYVASAGPVAADMRQFSHDVPLDRTHPPGLCVLENRQIHIEERSQHDAPIGGQTGSIRRQERLLPTGTTVYTPLSREGAAIGVMIVARSEVRPFQPHELELMRGFADQAVIAIENARLLSELRARTEELARSVEELSALGEVSQAVNSTLEVQGVLDTIVAKAVQISTTDAGSIYVFDEVAQEFRLRATYGLEDSVVARIKGQRLAAGIEIIGEATQRRTPLQIADLAPQARATVQDIIYEAGYRALLVIPLLKPGHIVGALVVRRKEAGEFPQRAVDLLQTFAAQSVTALENAALFREIEEKGRQLEIASQHKSQFLANMSHELRTPLNAILGYSELILDDIYGAIPEKVRGALGRVEANGKHLLGLINDVLDLSKIEAGQLTLSLSDYSIPDLINGVFSAVEPLATEKKLALKLDVPLALPVAHGDERRISQVLLNLVGNAIKFTDAGEIVVKASAADGALTLAVCDTGPGIALSDQAKIFEEFRQADDSNTRKKGGTGLGLSIAKHFIEMHGGRIWVESSLGHGSTFFVLLPVTVEKQMEHA
jgi:signal transduction histidine kinase/HAMP domain-containing protein